ncbi:PilZ domain-containing protein [uncultured Hyphomicrobium sp.]|uniref:PilZ domain-containing protein n=1 Tax=uncultured Hyphomicrobium sp. TaxID=194373 RepID=UPI0025F49C0D|nr:PilZ domain-containing protein [uncultured Hyphomicrobium sp.]
MDDNDKRGAPRKRVLKGAVIAFNDRTSTLSCAVKDISDTGARLKISKGVAAPGHFDLLIDIDGIEVPCTVVWRRGEEIGVTFDAPPTKGTPRRAQVVSSLQRTAPSIRRKP